MSLTRRSFLQAALLAPALGPAALVQGGARFISTVPLGDPGGRPPPPFGRLLGSGLDGRLFTDLSTLSADRPETLVTPAERFYVRTAATSDLRPSDPANLRPSAESAPDQRPDRPGTEVNRSDLRPSGQPGTEVDGIDRSKGRVRVGPYVMECAGNSDPTNFGLISAAT